MECGLYGKDTSLIAEAREAGLRRVNIGNRALLSRAY